LHGKVADRHAFIILNTKEQIEDALQPLICMVVSSSIASPGPAHILMPNKRDNKPCTTCFTRPCWAVSNWILRVTDRSKVDQRCGYIGGATLRLVMAKLTEAVKAGTMPIDYPIAPKPKGGPPSKENKESA
jgi:hypothetical protein